MGPIAVFLAVVCWGQAADTVGMTSEELESWRSGHLRWRDRMSEVRADARAFADLREREERARVSASFDGEIASYRSLEASQRDEVIARSESFLAKHADAAYASHVRFRLGELYYDKSFSDFQSAMSAFERRVEDAEAAGDLEALAAIGAEPKLDLSRSLAMYQRIIDDNRSVPADQRYERLDGAYLMMGYVLTDENSAQRNEESAKLVFHDLIAALPDSDLADRAHLFLGSLAFGEQKYDTAISEYQAVYDRGEKSPYYQEAIYQLAWSRFNLSDYPPAMAGFAQLLDLSEVEFSATGRNSPYRKDAIRYMSFGITNDSQDRGVPAAEAAEAYFRTLGPRGYERAVWVELADVLERYTRYEEMIAVYTKLQEDPRWVNEPDNPEWQAKLIALYTSNSQTLDLLKGGEARIDLSRRYGSDSSWAAANRTNPEAVSKVTAMIEKDLSQVALELLARASEAGDPADYRVAADRYRDYLVRFPLADDYYESRYYYGLALLGAGDLAGAEKEYEAGVKDRERHEHDDAVVYTLFNIRFTRFAEKFGTEDALPAGSPPERTYTTPANKTIQVFGLLPETQLLIRAADRAYTFDYTGTPADEAAIRDKAREQAPNLLYLTGLILFHHHQFEHARPRLQGVIDLYPQTDAASRAAARLVESYELEGDLDQVRASLERYLSMNLGEAAGQAEMKGKFQGALEDTAFLQAQQLASAEDWSRAADAYMKFYREFPKSGRAPGALYNAALYYEKAGKAELANRSYEDFANRYPTDPKSENIYFFVASNYEATFELDRAISYYDRLIQRFPNSKNAPAAVYNSAFLRIGVGDNLGAAKAFEDYARRFPEEADREKTHFRAGEQYEQVSDDQAMRFYQDYLDEYGYQNPDNALEAIWKVGQFYKDKGNTRQFESQRETITRAYDQIVASGKTVGPRGQVYAAEAAFPALVDAYNAYTAEKPPGKFDKDIALAKAKQDSVKAVQAEFDAFIAKYSSFEHLSGAFYYKSLLPLYVADLGLAIQPPEGLGDEGTADLWTQLETKVYPVYNALEDEGINRLNQLLQAARESKRYSKWVDEAIAELNRRRPDTYPAVKTELGGGVDVRVPPRLGPISPTPAKVPPPVAPAPVTP